MYLKTLNLWNFRKFGSGNNILNLELPDISITFKNGLNVLIGENDSGKTAIIDAIKIVLKTHSTDWLKIDQEDFYKDSKRLRVECIFSDLEIIEASHFTEWLGLVGENEDQKTYLKLILDVQKNDERVLPYDVRAGSDSEGKLLTAEAKDYLKVTYLKPLRDTHSELIPRRNSRLSQILYGHSAFKGREENHLLLDKLKELNAHIESYFDGKDKDGNDLPVSQQEGKNLKSEIDRYLKAFMNKITNFEVAGGNLKNILESLKILFENEKNLGLGSHNLLFISTELLHLNRANWTGLRLALIEEIEAHLHPQIQLLVIEELQKQKNIQFIFTTHSPNIGSKIKLENLIICSENSVFSMGKEYTKLAESDYKYLERFLDVTKANLFFAKGVILVEGWAEELILPELAKKINVNLSEEGISIINIGNTAFLRFSRIFLRNNIPEMQIPIAIITDLDIQPLEEDIMIVADNITRKEKQINIKNSKYNDQKVRAFISPHWTLEYCIAKSNLLRKDFYKAIFQGLKEMKIDVGVQNLQEYDNKILNVENEFTNWTENDDHIAYTIYKNIILDKNISKSIIAQKFAEIINSANYTKEELEEEPSIAYLLNAIKYASRNN